MPQSLHTLGAHIVFSTKGRQPWLVEAVRAKMHGYLATCLKTLDCHSIVVGGVVDHVHILCNLSKKVASTELLRIVKADSSKFAKTLSGDHSGFQWQTGYALFGVSPSHMSTVRQYVLSQEEHHRAESFQQELLTLLREANVEFDERYIWD